MSCQASVTAGSGESRGAGHAGGPRRRPVRACRCGCDADSGLPRVERESRDSESHGCASPQRRRVDRAIRRDACSSASRTPSGHRRRLAPLDRRPPRHRRRPSACSARRTRWRPWRGSPRNTVDGHTIGEPRPSQHDPESSSFPAYPTWRPRSEKEPCCLSGPASAWLLPFPNSSNQFRTTWICGAACSPVWLASVDGHESAGTGRM